MCPRGIEEHIEYLNIKHENTALYGDTPQGERVVIADDSLGSMSFWGITPDVFNYLESGFFEFLESNDNGVTKEYYLPDQIQAAIQGKHQSVTVYTALSPWYGVTYKSELEKVSNKLYELYHGRSNSHRPSAIKNEE